MKPAAVIGIDLSLRRTAAVYLPSDWEPGSWKGVRSIIAGRPLEGRDPAEQAARLRDIADELVKFVFATHARNVWIEDYAYALAGRAGMALAELGGAVKVQVLARCEIVVRPVNVMTARKLFLGKLPRKNAAAAVQDALKAMGSPFEGSDEGDAWVVGNFARSELGMLAATLG